MKKTYSLARPGKIDAARAKEMMSLEEDMYRQPYIKAVLCSLQMGWHGNVLVTAWIILLAVPFAHGDSELNRPRFLKEYQPHADSIQKRYSNIFIDFITTSDAGPTQQLVEHVTGKFNRWNFLLKGTWKDVQKDTGKVLSESKKERIYCRNALYSFTLRPGDNDDYVLSNLNIHDAIHETVLCFMTAPYADYVDKKTYLEIAQDPKTRILAFADCVWQGKPMKVLECQHSRIHAGTHKPIEVTTNFYFSPDDGWICYGWGPGSSLKSGEYVEEIYFYEPEQGERLPRLKRIERWLRNIQNPRQTKLCRARDITEFRRAAKPFADSDFTLSAFGFPDPVGVPQPEKPPRTWLWLLAAAIGAGLLAILFAQLKHRHATANSAKT